MTSQVILYDLPSKQGTAFSLNPWKTRMILNYKNIDYTTEWVEFPDLATKLVVLGIPPNDSSAPGYFTPYSSPAVRYPDGTYGMDSWPIAHELEKRYPTPALYLDNLIVVQVRDHILKFMMPLLAHLLPSVPSLLNERSATYFKETRGKIFGVELEQMAKEATEEGWVNAEAPAREMGDWLRKNGGPYFLGETVSYADFIFVSMLYMIKLIDEAKFQRFLALDEAFPKVFEASKKWLERDD